MMPIALLVARRNTNRSIPRARGGLPLELATGIAAALVLPAMVYPKLVSGWVPQPWLYLQFPYRLAGIAGMLATMATALALGRLGTPTGRGGAVRRLGPRRSRDGGVRGESGDASEPSDPRHVAGPARQPRQGAGSEYAYQPKTDPPEALGPRVLAARKALQATALSLHDTTNSLQVTLQVQQPTRVTLPRVAYDFLQVVDQAGRAVPLSGDYGLLAVSLPAGYHVLTVERRMPWPTRLAFAGTFLTAVLLAMVMSRRSTRNATP